MSTKFSTLPVSEVNYAQTMETVVEPFLAARRTKTTFPGFDGAPISYEAYPAENAVATVVIVHGYTESAEKFREMSYYFLMMGLNVFAIDNRGHGNSARRNPDDPQTVTIGRFEDYVEDLQTFVTTVVKPAYPDLPLYVYAHSMGGAITVQHLQTYPGVFERAVLSAPMIMAKMPMPIPAAQALGEAFVLAGKGDARVFVFHGFNPDATFETSNDTSKARFDYYHAKRLQNPLLQTASASYRWVREAAKVTKRNLDPKRCAKIQIPVLLFQPEEDHSVVSEKEDAFIAMVRFGRIVKLRGCRHEIYASVDDTLLQYLRLIEAFFIDE